MFKRCAFCWRRDPVSKFVFLKKLTTQLVKELGGFIEWACNSGYINSQQCVTQRFGRL